MSTTYTAEQYNQEFNAKRLQNYEIPKPVLAKVPKNRTSEITIIANDKGHLNPGVARSNTNPFGDYVGTWDLPKSISGPYQLNKTGRSKNNVEHLYGKKREIELAIKEAQENQKPISLRQNLESEEDNCN